MTRLPHHQKDFDKGDARLHQAAFQARLIWKMPWPTKLRKI